jgi:hypothetical protein
MPSFDGLSRNNFGHGYRTRIALPDIFQPAKPHPRHKTPVAGV